MNACVVHNGKKSKCLARNALHAAARIRSCTHTQTLICGSRRHPQTQLSSPPYRRQRPPLLVFRRRSCAMCTVLITTGWLDGRACARQRGFACTFGWHFFFPQPRPPPRCPLINNVEFLTVFEAWVRFFVCERAHPGRVFFRCQHTHTHIIYAWRNRRARAMD